MNLSVLMEHSFRLYGKRNRIFLQGLRDRIDFLNLAIGDLQDVVRKDADKKIVGIMLARIISRIFCIAEHFHGLDLVWAMSRKYAADWCNYCREKPCVCVERRNDAKIQEAVAANKLQWGLREWCNHLNILYGLRNREKGIENIVNRLFKEVCEFLSLSMAVGNGTQEGSLEIIEEEYAFELADALAWTIAIANLLEIDLEAAFLARYGNGCTKCGGNPCRCTRFSMAPLRWDQVTT